jgi:hypothetical protein
MGSREWGGCEIVSDTVRKCLVPKAVDLIMIFAGGDDNMIGENPVDQTMFLCNTSGPISRPIPFKRFRLPVPWKGSLEISVMRVLILSKIFLSSLAQQQ